MNSRRHEDHTLFVEQVLSKRPYLRAEWCQEVLARPMRREDQADGRIRYWGRIEGMGGRVLRVVTLADGVTVHNAFPDRSFKQR
ncbi:MAG: hypothetical protein FJX47_12595 [Alphaproteobacteria bacterium]|nr:hypothetical protein [Alphaproteobacteria bacterium]